MTATADWVVKFGNIVLNHVLVWMRPGMAVKPGFTKCVGSTPFVTPQGTLQVGPTHRISSFPLSSFRLPRDSNPGPRVFSPMGSISGTN